MFKLSGKIGIMREMTRVNVQRWKYVTYFPTNSFILLSDYLIDNNIDIWGLKAKCKRSVKIDKEYKELEYLTIKETQTVEFTIDYNFYHHQSLNLLKIKSELEKLGIDEIAVESLAIALLRKDLCIPKLEKQSIKMIALFERSLASRIEKHSKLIQIVEEVNKNTSKFIKNCCLDLTQLIDSREWLENKNTTLDINFNLPNVRKVRELLDFNNNFLKIRSHLLKNQQEWSLVDVDVN